MQVSKVPLWLINFLIFVYHSTPILFAVAAPKLEAEIGTQINLAQLMSSVYFSGFTCGLMLFGRISDLQGRRKSMLSGIFIFTITSLFLTFSSNTYTLLALKFLQAFGVSACSIVTQATSRDSYQGADLMKIYGLNGILVCLIPTIETTIGGMILEKFSWRYCMAWDTFKGITLFICCLLYLTETLPEQTRQAASQIRFFDVFKRFISDKTVIMYALISGLSIGMFTGFIIEMPFLFVKVFHIKPSVYGMLNIVVSIALLIANFLNLYLISRKYLIKNFLYYSLGISLVSSVVFLILSLIIPYDSPFGFVIMIAFMAARILQGIVHSILMPYILGIALEKYRGLFGSASAIFNSFYYFVISILVFIISYVHQDSSIYAFIALICLTSTLTLLLFKQANFSAK